MASESISHESKAPTASADGLEIHESKIDAASTTLETCGDVEIQAVDEPEKTYYSRLSVWLMVLFSGLAIGSDGYNAAVIGNVELLLAVLYPEALTDAIYRLSTAFLVGMIIGMLLFGVVVDVLGRKTGAV